jgi:GDP-L-fucose synthase
VGAPPTWDGQGPVGARRLDGVRLLLTGASGFLGRHLAAAAASRGATVLTPPRAAADLRDRAAVARLFVAERPDVVVHAAVQGGGIGWMRSHPVESGRDNSLMALAVLDAAHAAGVRAVVGVGSACAYPRDCPVPFREETLWDGAPEPLNAAYGMAKRLMIELGSAYSAQFGLPVASPLLANLYGPGDHLSPARAHVIAALIQRCLAGPAALVVWGTGTPTREHLFVTDAADGVLASIGHDGPINIGSGEELSIRAIAAAVAAATEYRGPISFDVSQPDGQPRKCLDTTRAAAVLGWRATVPLAAGLAQTVAWYRAAQAG